jgi:5-methylcytosine-specific restriction enzyme subunit McrC
MRITVPTNHHYYESNYFDEEKLCAEFNVKAKRKRISLVKDLFSNNFELNTAQHGHQQLKIIGFKERRFKLEENTQLILRLSGHEKTIGTRYAIETGLFAGIIFHKGYTFNITTSYGNVLLNRMLNFVNDIYLDNKSVSARQEETTNEFQSIIAYLFIQSLEKAGVLGLPKRYESFTERNTKVKGKINITEYLKKDVPFQGSLASMYKKQCYVQEIIDVLFAACKKVESYFGANYKSKIIGLYQILNESHSKRYVSSIIISKAKTHSVLNDPLFGQFKKVLEYAAILLENHNLQAVSENKQLKTHGYLFDVSQLFEIYLEKLLKRHFTAWDINGQEELNVYKGLFYGGRMFPDLVMRNKLTNEVIVFDAKFKMMRGKNIDVDRSDFFQIHTYMQYYETDVIFGGLIYPLSEEISRERSVSNSLFENNMNDTQFIIDGISVNNQMTFEELIANEQNFLSRIESLIDSSRIKRNKAS